MPEEDEDNREVSVDKHMAQAMEERLLRGFEQEMIRDRQAMIKSIMRDGTGARPFPHGLCCALCDCCNPCIVLLHAVCCEQMTSVHIRAACCVL